MWELKEVLQDTSHRGSTIWCMVASRNSRIWVSRPAKQKKNIWVDNSIMALKNSDTMLQLMKYLMSFWTIDPLTCNRRLAEQSACPVSPGLTKFAANAKFLEGKAKCFNSPRRIYNGRWRTCMGEQKGLRRLRMITVRAWIQVGVGVLIAESSGTVCHSASLVRKFKNW